MAAQSVAPRSRQPQRVDSDDAVLARALEFSEWAKRHIRLVIASAVVLAILLGGLLYYRMYQADRMTRAATEYMQVQQSVGTGNMALATQDLERFISRYDGTAYADEARVQLGQIQLQQGESARAVEVLRPFADRIGRGPVGAQGALLLATAQGSAGDANAAVQTYLRVADRAEYPYQRQEALNAAAAIREEQGDFAGAAEIYGRLVQTTEEGSLERGLFEMRRTEAEARATAR